MTVQAMPYHTLSVPDQRRILIVYVSPGLPSNSAISKLLSHDPL